MPKVIADQQILEAAVAVITDHGYAGATTRALAAAAGINEVTLFRRFGTKQNLLRAVVEQEAANFVTAGVDYTGDVRADLQRVVFFYHNLLQQRGRVITMLLNELPRQPELMEIMQTPLSIIDKVTALLQRYQQEGVLCQEPPRQAFMALVGPLFLAGTLGALLPSPDAPPGATSDDSATLVDAYLQGRRAR